jgi:cell wall-associated NlpC family hydrolase
LLAFFISTSSAFACGIPRFSALQGLTATKQDPVSIALRYLGTRYGNGNGHLDCSGLVTRVFGQLGIFLPHHAQAQVDYGEAIAFEDIQPGDLLFFARSPGQKTINHVGIALGDGLMIHASLKHREVLIDNLEKPYYQTRQIAARRIVN